MNFLTEFIELVPTGCLQGLLVGILAMGVMIPFRLLQLPDLSAEGTFPFGGCLCAVFILNGVNPFLATLAAVFAGACIGGVVAAIHMRFKVHTLLVGIVVASILYSLNLRLLGKPNIALFNLPTVFSFLEGNLLYQIEWLLGISFIIFGGFYIFLKTEVGLRFRAVGLNSNFARMQGINVSFYVGLGFAIANGLNGLAGALFVQIQSYADVGIGVGIVIHALAALMIGEVLLGVSQSTLVKQLLAPIVGSLIYQQLQGAVLALGVEPTDFKLVTGILVLLALAAQAYSGKEKRLKKLLMKRL